MIQRNRRFTGTYSVSPECTGTASFIGQDGVPIGTLEFVLTNNGRDVQFIQIDQGMTISGTGKQQFPQ